MTLTVFVFGVFSFATVPPVRRRVMHRGGNAPELAATANISAFNIVNASSEPTGGAVIGSSPGAAAIFAFAAILPTTGPAPIAWRGGGLRVRRPARSLRESSNSTRPHSTMTSAITAHSQGASG